MVILLVTWTDQLLKKLSALNPQLEFCAIVVDDVESAQEILQRVGLPKDLLYPLYELKECTEELYYDYVLCADDGWGDDFLKIVQDYDVPKEKILALNFLCRDNFLVERSLHYFKEHAAEFDMFATGLSYAEVGLDVTRFKRKLFNFAHSSQDLYYNLQVAKFAVSCAPPGKIRYALINLAPYSFHYDLSQADNLQFLMLHYLLAFDDLHNFRLSAAEYRKFLREKYLSMRLPLEPFDVNNPFYVKSSLRFMTPESKLRALKSRKKVGRKNFPATRAENVKILDEYLTLCEQNSIRPIIFLTPMSELYMKHYPNKNMNEFRFLVNQACRKHSSAIFIDGWEIDNLMTDKDFYDYGHMNIQGAAKFSMFLSEFIGGLEAQGL